MNYLIIIRNWLKNLFNFKKKIILPNTTKLIGGKFYIDETDTKIIYLNSKSKGVFKLITKEFIDAHLPTLDVNYTDSSPKLNDLNLLYNDKIVGSKVYYFIDETMYTKIEEGVWVKSKELLVDNNISE